MKKNLFMTAAAIAALLTGCSTDEEIANIETSAKNAIGFNIVSNSAETKATIYNNGSTNFDFDVFAFNSTTGKLFMGTHQTDFGHDGVDIYYNTTDQKWDYRNPDKLAYWPTNDLDFYAVSPATFDNNLLGFLQRLIHFNEQKIIYSTVDEFSTGTKNLDVMYAVAKQQRKNANGGVVSLNFKHTLSQVLFRAKVQYEFMEVTIKKMMITNFYTGGTFTFPTDDNAPTQRNWSSTDEQHTGSGGFTVKKAGTDITASSTTEAQWITVENDPMLFIPQTLTAWKTTPESAVTKADGDSQNNSYLIIDMKLTQNKQYLIGSETEYKTIYVPFGAEWQPGKRYIYTLNFGGGYDEHGKPMLTPITFEASVENWKDTSENTQDVPAYTN